jgi:hypothetical protein
MATMTYPPPPGQLPYQPQYGPPPSGAPWYQPGGLPQYAPNPYGPPQYPPHAQPPPGYGYLPAQPRRVCEPILGWLLLAAGVLLVVSAALPWATALDISVAGTRGGGAVTGFFGLVLAGFGIVIGVRRGLLWVPITSCVLSALVTIIAVANMGSIANLAAEHRGELPANFHASIGVGLWLTLSAGLAVLGLSIAGMARRPVQHARS